jgi:hypothetical protein
MPPQVDVSTGKIAFGPLESNHSFQFTIPTVATTDITVTAQNSNIQPYQWFTPDPATIPAGSKSVNVEAMEPSPPAGWLTYSVKGMNVTTINPHIIIDDGD